MLVDRKADIDALDAVGATPLHFAVRWGSESIVKFILRNKGRDEQLVSLHGCLSIFHDL